MAGGNAPAPPTPIIVAAFIMTFAAGLLDAVTLLSFTGSTTTHMSGKVLKVGTYAAEGALEETLHYLALVTSFLCGAVVAGVCTATPQRKVPRTAARVAFAVGVLEAGVGVMLRGEAEEAVYVAAFAAGLQNALTTTVTGFMRTTHFTGTITDVGLLLGQAYPLNVHNAAHWWKTQILSGLIFVFAAAGAVGAILFDWMGSDFAFVASAFSLLCGLAGEGWLHFEARSEARDAKAQEAGLANDPSHAPVKKQPEKKKKRRESEKGFLQLRELARDMHGNPESMPNAPLPGTTEQGPLRIAFTAPPPRSKLSLFGSSPGKVLPYSSDEVGALSNANERQRAVCAFLLHPKRRGVLADLERSFQHFERSTRATPQSSDDSDGGGGANQPGGGNGDAKLSIEEFLASFLNPHSSRDLAGNVLEESGKLAAWENEDGEPLSSGTPLTADARLVEPMSASSDVGSEFSGNTEDGGALVGRRAPEDDDGRAALPSYSLPHVRSDTCLLQNVEDIDSEPSSPAAML